MWPLLNMQRQQTAAGLTWSVEACVQIVQNIAHAQVRVALCCLHMQVPQVLGLRTDGLPYMPWTGLPGRLLRVRGHCKQHGVLWLVHER